MTALIAESAERCLRHETASIGFDSIPWGSPDVVFTPAFWAEVTRQSRTDDSENHRLTDSFANESIMCLLGGHGIPAEHGIAAFRMLAEANLLLSLIHI